MKMTCVDKTFALSFFLYSYKDFNSLNNVNIV